MQNNVSCMPHLQLFMRLQRESDMSILVSIQLIRQQQAAVQTASPNAIQMGLQVQSQES